MLCTKCGAEVPDGSVACPKCGNTLSAQRPVVMNYASQRAPKSVAGFVCGLLGFILDWIPIVGLVLSIVGVALCGKGKREVQMHPQEYTGTGLLTAGQVLGIIGIIVSSIVLLVYIIWGLILGSVGFFSIFEGIADIL